MKRALFIIIPLLLIGGGIYFFIGGRSDDAPVYRFATIERGDIESTVSSTGTINPVGIVEVGTQVSGTIEKVFVDFNDPVSKGQLLALLDTRVLQASVDDAASGLDRAQAQYRQALESYNRFKPLYDKGYVSAQELLTYESSLTTARASVRSAQIAVERARTNLQYTEIRSPIDGKVIARDIDVGQTVAASLSAPRLFVIAQDLSHMEIHANVDEGDIGQIKVGQPAHFTVQSNDDRTFSGIVREIRLQPETVQNVVNYTVIVDAPNDQGILLPGMTATIDFQVARAMNVLMVPNAALRYRPSAEELAELQTRRGADSGRSGRRAGAAAGSGDSGGRAAGGAASAGTAGAGTAGGEASGGGAAGGAMRTAAGGSAGGARRAGGAAGSRLWYLDSTGKLASLPVKTGLNDGQNTEISSPRAHEGMKVIIGVEEASSAKQPAATPNPFAPGGGAPGGARGTRTPRI